MEFIKKVKTYRPKQFYLKHFLQSYWFIPSDVLQRGIEASIWDLCTFKAPILDIGIGNGTLSSFLFRKQGQMAVGIDIEESGLETARATRMYKKVLLANAEKMPFKDASFNTVVSNSTFEHITNDFKAVSEVSRVLKKNGLFFITVPNNYLLQWITEYEEKKNKKAAKENIKQFNERAVHLHYRSYEEWVKCFKKNNMEIVFYQYYFPKDVALFWYKMFRLFTKEVLRKEVWSHLGHSRLTRYMPKSFLINVLEKTILKKFYMTAFFTNSQPGGQLFIIARKK